MAETTFTEISPAQRKVLNDALDRERERRGLTSDVALAVALQTTPKMVWMWRKGHLTKLDAMLVELLIPNVELVDM